MWSPVVHPKSPFVWLVDQIKTSCWYCTVARAIALTAGAVLLGYGHWVTGIIAFFGVVLIVVVERLAACHSPD